MVDVGVLATRDKLEREVANALILWPVRVLTRRLTPETTFTLTTTRQRHHHPHLLSFAISTSAVSSTSSLAWPRLPPYPLAFAHLSVSYRRSDVESASLTVWPLLQTLFSHLARRDHGLRRLQHDMRKGRDTSMRPRRAYDVTHRRRGYPNALLLTDN